MINVVTVKWGKKFGSDYVNNLFNAITRHTTIPVQYHCFTDDCDGIDDNVTTHELPTGMSGYWNKVYLFSSDHSIQGRVVFIDLDTLITSNIDDILQASGEFIGIKVKTSHGHFVEVFSSAFMAWDAGKHTHIWTEFVANQQQIVKQKKFGKAVGDQGWIGHIQPTYQFWQDLFPNRFVYFVLDCQKGLPKNASVVMYESKFKIVESYSQYLDFNGQYLSTKYNRPAQLWVKEHWK